MIVYVLKLDNYKVSARYGGRTIKYQYNKFLTLSTDNIGFYVVARGGIEPPTHGFSVRKQYISPLF